MRNPSQETKNKIRVKNIGRKQSVETIAKRVEKLKGIPRTPETKLKISLAHKGVKLTPSRLKEMSKYMKGRYSGCNHPSADHSIYVFYHVSGETFTGTRIALCDKYSIPYKRLSLLFCKKSRKTVCNWSLKVENFDLPHPKEDLSVYKFLHKTGEVFVGTHSDFCKKYSLAKNRINQLFYKGTPNKSIYGWFLDTTKTENLELI